MIPVVLSEDEVKFEAESAPPVAIIEEERPNLGIEEEQKTPMANKKQEDDENDWVDVVSGASSDN